MHACMHVHTYVRMYRCTMYVCMHACMHVRTYVCMYGHYLCSVFYYSWLYPQKPNKASQPRVPALGRNDATDDAIHAAELEGLPQQRLSPVL